MTSRSVSRPISAEEAEVVRAALDRAPTDRPRTSLLGDVAGLVVVDRCKCGCATVDFRSDVKPGGSTLLADALGKTADGHYVGIIVWGDDEHITGLEIYDFEPKSSHRLPQPESIVSWEEAGRRTLDD